MSRFEKESHEFTHEDTYVKEVCVIKFIFKNDGIEESFLVPYFRKASKDGGLFWSVASVGIQKNGKKVYEDGFMHDSKILDKKIKEYLESRAWEKQSIQIAQPQQNYYPNGHARVDLPKPFSMKEVAAEEQLPF